ncbi:MAG: hypothetical protein J7K68_00135 [Candidatus Diapherotrites archaeon]|nr:hypothetical protein [Candidatus Diapherotrites archaeon]
MNENTLKVLSVLRTIAILNNVELYPEQNIKDAIQKMQELAEKLEKRIELKKEMLEEKRGELETVEKSFKYADNEKRDEIREHKFQLEGKICIYRKDLNDLIEQRELVKEVMETAQQMDRTKTLADIEFSAF